jgi:hypothetical protein
MGTNNIRDLEEMNKIPSEEGGDAYLCNGNLITLANAMNNLPKSLQKAGNTSENKV